MVEDREIEKLGGLSHTSYSQFCGNTYGVVILLDLLEFNDFPL